MFTTYKLLDNMFVYTASGEPIPVVGTGTVGGIPNCLHVPTLEKDLLSVPHMDVSMGWRTIFEAGACVIDDKATGCVKFTGTLDRSMMLYVVPVEQLLGDDYDAEDKIVAEAHEQALAVMTKGEYVNKLHDIVHCHARRLEAMVKGGVMQWPFDPKKVKPVSFKKCLKECDACGLAKTTRVTFKGKVMTDMTVGSVWQTDISGMWATPSLQGNKYTIGYIERKSRKIFLYFSRHKDVYMQTKDLLESEIPKCRLRHGMKDFIIHSDVGEFQSDKIRGLVRAAGGEIQKGSAYTPEAQCFIERSWRTVKEMASTFILASGLSEPYWECAQGYASQVYARTVRPVGDNNELMSPDDIYYGVKMDMHLFQPFGCRAYINIAKETRRKNHKGRAELAIFVGFEENTIPGYKFYRPLYRDFVTTAHARFMKFTRRTDINLNPQSDSDEVKEGTVQDFRYLEGTVHRDDVDGLVYETTWVVEETYPRRGTFVVAYRRLVYASGARGPEETEATHVRDIEKMTACTDEEILDEYGVAPVVDADSSPDEHGMYATGSDDDAGVVSKSHDDVDDDAPQECSYQWVGGAIGDDVSVSGTNGSDPVRGSRKDNTVRSVASADDGKSGKPQSVINGPYSGHRRKRAAERLEAADAGSQPAKRRKGLSSIQSDKRGSVTRVFPVEGAEKCQHREQTVSRAPVRIDDDFKSADEEEVEVQTQGSKQISVPVMETETPGDVDDDEAALPTVDHRRRGERVRKKPKTLVFTTESERDNNGSEDTSASDFDEQDDFDSHTKTAVLTAAIGGDAIAQFACIAGLAGMKNISDYPEPMDYKEALDTPDAERWAEAMNEEFDSMKRTELLSDPVRLPVNGRVIGTKWVFKRKRNLEGGVERFRARLVAKGFSQIFGLDYFGTYAPVARLGTLRILYALAVLMCLTLASLDVEAAFMNANLDEELYIRAPPGTDQLPEGHVYRLKKSLYGLKQSPKQWNDLLRRFLINDCGLTQLKSDECLFYKRAGEHFKLVAIYVDDIVIAYNNHSMFRSFKDKLKTRFKCKDLGELLKALNMGITRTADGGLFLSQEAYVRDLLERFKDHVPAGANSVELPADPKIRLNANGSEKVKRYQVETTGEHESTEGAKECEGNIPYKELLGALLWLSQGTRPDITYAVSQCAKFAQKPRMAHWWALKRILRYLKGTMDYGIHYQRPGPRDQATALGSVDLPNGYMSSQSAREAAGLQPLDYSGNVDSDYENSLDDKRSVTGYVNVLAKGSVTWQSKT